MNLIKNDCKAVNVSFLTSAWRHSFPKPDDDDIDIDVDYDNQSIMLIGHNSEVQITMKEIM